MKKFFLFATIVLFFIPEISFSNQNTLATIFFSKFIKNGDLVFDVGACDGDKTEIFISCGAKVVCFEPQKLCVARLCKKFANKNVIIVPKGLSSNAGYTDFFQYGVLSTCSKDWTETGRFKDCPWPNPIKIEVTTLKEMIDMYGIPKFCKIDVENSEYEVLSTLSVIIPALSFEFTYEFKSSAKKCLDHLEKLGYKKFNFVAGENFHFEFDEWLTAEKLLEKIYSGNKYHTDLWGDIYAKYE